jgi:hypothetical protein
MRKLRMATHSALAADVRYFRTFCQHVREALAVRPHPTARMPRLTPASESLIETVKPRSHGCYVFHLLEVAVSLTGLRSSTSMAPRAERLKELVEAHEDRVARHQAFVDRIAPVARVRCAVASSSRTAIAATLSARK